MAPQEFNDSRPRSAARRTGERTRANGGMRLLTQMRKEQVRRSPGRACEETSSSIALRGRDRRGVQRIQEDAGAPRVRRKQGFSGIGDYRLRVLHRGGTFATMISFDCREISGDGGNGDWYCLLRRRWCDIRLRACARGLHPGAEQKHENKEDPPHHLVTHANGKSSLTI